MNDKYKNVKKTVRMIFLAGMLLVAGFVAGMCYEGTMSDQEVKEQTEIPAGDEILTEEDVVLVADESTEALTENSSTYHPSIWLYAM